MKELGRRRDEAGSHSRSEIERLQGQLQHIKSRLAALAGPEDLQLQNAHTEDALSRQIRVRRLRDQLFGAGLFSDPAWDILLELYASDLAQTRMAGGELSIRAVVPPSTAMRWISKLEQDGWLVRLKDPLDSRRAFVELTPKGVSTMHQYFRLVE